MDTYILGRIEQAWERQLASLPPSELASTKSLVILGRKEAPEVDSVTPAERRAWGPLLPISLWALALGGLFQNVREAVPGSGLTSSEPVSQPQGFWRLM